MSSLSVVMPVYNEARHLPETVDALVAAVEQSGFAAEVVLVDDGSTDGSAAVAEEELAGRLPLRVLAQPNRGRFLARKAGLEAAGSEWVLLLDGRVLLDPASLAYVDDRVRRGSRVWTAHVVVDSGRDLYATFWKLIAELAWPEYFADPRETSFGADEFDRYPKGTTCFLAPRELLLDAVSAFRTRYADLRHANDDTPMLRWIAERDRIHVSPGFRCTYRARSTFGAFTRHSVHRGTVFVDGHGRRESRFFPLVVGFFPVSAAAALVALRRPAVVWWVAAGTSVGASALGIARRRTGFEVASLALLAPVYAAAHGLGMWRGLLGLAAARRIGSARSP